MAFTLSLAKTWLRDQNRESPAARDERIATRICNDANRAMHSFGDWDFDRRSVELDYAGTYDTGTLTTNGTTALVGSGTTFTAAMVGRYIRINGDVMQYLIATFTDATHITITPAYRGASASALTYEITCDRVALPSDFRAMYEAQTDLVVTPLLPSTIDDIKYQRKFNKEVNYPRVYAIEWFTGNITTANVTPVPYLWIYPPPSSARVCEVAYYGLPLEVSGDSDVFGVPYQAEGVLREFMLAFLLAYQRDPNWSAQLGKARREAEISLAAYRSRLDMGQKREWSPYEDAGNFYAPPGFDPLAPGQPSYI